MTDQEWVDKFYPIAADSLVKQINKHPDELTPGDNLCLIEHSLNKWRGLDYMASPPISFRSSTCALCRAYVENKDVYREDCSGCPIYESRGQVPCDAESCDEEASPYHTYLIDHNHEPMIKALEKARDFVIKQLQEDKKLENQ